MEVTAPPTHPAMKVDGPPLPNFPFNDADADVILRSADNVDFHVHKLLLSLSSQVFRDMFTLPQGKGVTKSILDGLPVIPVTEDRYALKNLLMWCDPRGEPATETLDDLLVVLVAADKYGMDRIIVRVANALKKSPFMAQDPVRVFAIAWRYRLEEVVRAAAKSTLPLTLAERPNSKELKSIPATALQHLHDYYHTCGRAASLASQNLNDYFPAALVCSSRRRGTACWWPSYQDHLRTALLDRPCRATVFDAIFQQIPETHGCSECKYTKNKGPHMF